MQGTEERQKDLEVLENGSRAPRRRLIRWPNGARTKVQESSAEEAGRKADAEMAAAAVEDLTVKLGNAMSEQTREAEQETASLKKEFKAEQDELVGKLDKMRDKYFENAPGSAQRSAN